MRRGTVGQQNGQLALEQGGRTGRVSPRPTETRPQHRCHGSLAAPVVGESTGQGTEIAQVQCYRPNGTLVDGYYSVMLGS